MYLLPLLLRVTFAVFCSIFRLFSVVVVVFFLVSFLFLRVVTVQYICDGREHVICVYVVWNKGCVPVQS